MKVKQRTKRKPLLIWASQLSGNTGCTHFLSPQKVGELRLLEYPNCVAWSKPK